MRLKNKTGLLQLWCIAMAVFGLFAWLQPCAWAAVGVEGGYSIEYLQVSATDESEERSFSLPRLLGFQLGVDAGAPIGGIQPYFSIQAQLPFSLARFESTKAALGARYYLNPPHVSADGTRSPFIMRTRTSRLFFVQVSLIYHRFFYAAVDLDGLIQTFDRSAAGAGIGFGVDFFLGLLSSTDEWRYVDDTRLRLRLVSDFSLSIVSPDEFPISLMSLSLKLMLAKPL
jgi:hypothetical protein